MKEPIEGLEFIAKKPAWDTADEIKWLDNIGETMDESKIKNLDKFGKVALLQGYIKGAEQRMKWDAIFHYDVVRHARKLLAREMAG